VKRAAVVVVTFVVLSFSIAAVGAADEPHLEPLIPDDTAAWQVFGNDVAVDAATGRILIGAYLHGPEQAGAAYMVEPDADGWSWTPIQWNPPGRYDWAGSGVALEGTLAVVGVPRDDRVRPGGGALDLFRLVGDHWVQNEILAPDDLEVGSALGLYVDVDGGRIASSSPFIDPYGRTATYQIGWAYVFEYGADGEWTWTRLDPPDGVKRDWFGTDIHISGDLVAVGSPGNDEAGQDAGAVYLYRRVDGVWTLEEKILPIDPHPGLAFGSAISMDGDRIAVAAPYDWNHDASLGRVHLLTHTDDGWQQEIAYAGDPKNPNLGADVYLNGSTIYVSAFGYNSRVDQPGVVIRVDETSDGWQETARYPAPEKAYGFGWAIEGGGSVVAIGAPGGTQAGKYSGAAYVMGEPAPTCSGRPATIVGTPGPDELAGTSSRDVIVAGSGDDTITGVDAGDLVCAGRGADLIDGPAVVVDLSRLDVVLNDGGRTHGMISLD